MPITITYRQLIIGILLLVLSYSSLATESSNLIKDITFNRGDKGEGIITISLPNQDIAPSVQEKAGKIIVKLPNTALPKLLQKEINVAESKTPIQTINASTNNQNTNISILPIDYYAYSAYQLNETLVITLWKTPKQPQVRIQSSAQFKNNYYVSLNLPNTDIRIILQTLADDKKINLVVTDSVTGKMTLRTQDIAWEQVLDDVLRINNLGKRLEGNVLIIAPMEELSTLSRKIICPDGKSVSNDYNNLKRALLPINYADAKTIINFFEQQKSKRQNKSSLAIDKRTNTIIAYQTPENLELLNKIIKELDIPITQVRLEANVFKVNKDYITFIKTQFNQGKPIDLLLNNMQKEGWGEVISQPKVTTSNKEEARIVKGQETHCHFNQSCSSEPTLSFTITPEIINDSQLKLFIEIYMEPVENQNKASPVKKQFEKIANNNQAIILDELADLEYPIKNDHQSQLMIIITPRIVDHKAFSTR